MLSFSGTYLAKECEGLVQLASPALHSVLRKLVFVVSSAATEFQPSAVACLVLSACYAMWNSSLAKTKWTGEFMLYLKLVESELVHGQEVFRRPGFLAVLERQLRACEEKLRVITSRTPVASFLFATADEEDLLRLTAALEAIKAQALQGMLTDVKGGLDQTHAALTAMLADLQQKQAAGFEPDQAATGSAFVEAAMLRSMRRLAEDARLKAALGMQDHAADVARLAPLLVRGTREELLSDFEEWQAYHATTPPVASAAAATSASAPAAAASSGSAPTPSVRPHDEGRDRMFWVEAAPGVGKSVLAAALCARYHASVCALHFCTAASSSGGDEGAGGVSPRNDPFAIVKSVCMQLAQRVPAYRSWLLGAVDSNADQLREKLTAAVTACATTSANSSAVAAPAGGARFPSLRKMVEEMFVRPLHGINAAAVRSGDNSGLPDCVRGDADVVVVDAAPASDAGGASSAVGAAAAVSPMVHVHPSGPRKMLIMIDALDESYAPEPKLSAENSDPAPAPLGDNDLVRALSDFACRLPPWLGLVLTSTAGSRVRRGLGGKYSPRIIEAQGGTNLADAALAVRDAVRRHPAAPAAIDDAAVQAVVNRSEGMLLYLAHLLPPGRAEALPHSPAAFDRADADLGSEYWLPALQRLYVSVERAADADPMQPPWGAYHAVLSAVMQAVAPLSLEQLGQAVSSDLVPSSLHLQRVLDRAYPLLSVCDGVVRPAHASLRSWMQSGERQLSDQELPFYCGSAQADSY